MYVCFYVYNVPSFVSPHSLCLYKKIESGITKSVQKIYKISYKALFVFSKGSSDYSMHFPAPN